MLSQLKHKGFSKLIWMKFNFSTLSSERHITKMGNFKVITSFSEIKKDDLNFKIINVIFYKLEWFKHLDNDLFEKVKSNEKTFWSFLPTLPYQIFNKHHRIISKILHNFQYLLPTKYWRVLGRANRSQNKRDLPFLWSFICYVRDIIRNIALNRIIKCSFPILFQIWKINDFKDIRNHKWVVIFITKRNWTRN